MQAQEDKKEDLESWGQHKQEQDKLDEQRGSGGLVICVKNEKQNPNDYKFNRAMQCKGVGMKHLSSFLPPLSFFFPVLFKVHCSREGFVFQVNFVFYAALSYPAFPTPRYSCRLSLIFHRGQNILFYKVRENRMEWEGSESAAETRVGMQQALFAICYPPPPHKISHT